MTTPINYDFGKNWNEKVKPHLDNPELKKAIKRGLRRYGGMTHRKRFIMPVDFLYNDFYYMLRERKIDYIVNRLKRDNSIENDIVLQISSYGNPDENADIDDLTLFPDRDTCLMHNVMKARTTTRKPRRFNLKDEKIITNDELEYDSDNDEELQAWTEERERLHKKYFPDSQRKYDLESYVLLGGCYYWAPTFELTLARLVEPNEEWRVREGDKHSTVINKDQTKVFDLLYWILDGRIENYIFGKPVEEEDPTLGGKLAFENSEKREESKLPMIKLRLNRNDQPER